MTRFFHIVPFASVYILLMQSETSLNSSRISQQRIEKGDRVLVCFKVGLRIWSLPSRTEAEWTRLVACILRVSLQLQSFAMEARDSFATCGLLNRRHSSGQVYFVSVGLKHARTAREQHLLNSSLVLPRAVNCHGLSYVFWSQVGLGAGPTRLSTDVITKCWFGRKLRQGRKGKKERNCGRQKQKRRVRKSMTKMKEETRKIVKGKLINE